MTHMIRLPGRLWISQGEIYTHAPHFHTDTDTDTDAQPTSDSASTNTAALQSKQGSGFCRGKCLVNTFSGREFPFLQCHEAQIPLFFLYISFHSNPIDFDLSPLQQHPPTLPTILFLSFLFSSSSSSAIPFVLFITTCLPYLLA